MDIAYYENLLSKVCNQFNQLYQQLRKELNKAEGQLTPEPNKELQEKQPESSSPPEKPGNQPLKIEVADLIQNRQYMYILQLSYFWSPKVKYEINFLLLFSILFGPKHSDDLISFIKNS